MTAAQRAERALAQLLKVARHRAEELQGHVASLEAAKVSAESALQGLAEAVAAEERASAGGAAVIDLGRFLTGADQKRRAIEETRATLEAQIASVRGDLQEAFAEMKKLEHLAESGRRASAVAARQKDIATAADLASMRRRG